MIVEPASIRGDPGSCGLSGQRRRRAGESALSGATSVAAGRVSASFKPGPDSMRYLIHAYIGFVLAVFLVPVAIRLGVRWGVVDKPDPRRVHKGLIPRTGGIAIALAALTAMAGAVIGSRELLGYALGAGLLIGFGVWDDIRELGYRIKFLGQILAILVFKAVSGLGVCCFGELIPGFVLHLEWLSILSTLIFMLATINIINLSDGLDSLAGGLSLLILLACALLGHAQGSGLPIILALSVAGGLIGFMRFNVHPAQVFMGDAGSQFLGFSIAVCLIMITQGNSICSPVLPLFLLGTPILDTSMVMYERIRAGVSPFRPDKNHLHHKLLRAGLDQEQAVVSIYALHFLLILAGWMLRHAADYYLLGIYLVIIGVLFLTRRLATVYPVDRAAIFAAIRSVARFVFVWNNQRLDFRYWLSWICWKSFFMVFALFFMLGTAAMGEVGIVDALLAAGGLVGVIGLWRLRPGLVEIFVYYGMFVIILNAVVRAGFGPPALDILGLGVGMTPLFQALAALYFGCMVLTPERVPLNAIDYLLLGLIALLLVAPEGTESLLLLRGIIMQIVLLGLALNLIYSRIGRNRVYVTGLFAAILLEHLVLFAL